MRALLPLLLLTVALQVHAAPNPTAAPKANDTAARALLDKVSARYRALEHYRFEGQVTTEAGNATQHQEQVLSTRYLVDRPHRFAMRLHSGEQTQIVVSDADSVWTALPAMGQYVVQPTKAVRASGDSVLFRQMDPAHDMPALLAAATAVRGMGPDTVRTANGAVACQRIALTVPRPAGAPDNITMHPRVLWIDPTTSLVLLDSMRVEQQNPQAGLVHVVTMIRQVVATADPSFEASAFRFSEGTGLRRVKRFLPPSEKHADMEGQPAPDFTLEKLADAKPVKLSDLKGHVVVLDFWATWCGPCRRWLPIVAKAARDHAAKGLIVYAVNEAETTTQVKAFLEKQKLEVPVLMDLNSNVGRLYRAESIPLTVVVGRDGRVVRVLVGVHEAEDLAAVLEDAGL